MLPLLLRLLVVPITYFFFKQLWLVFSVILLLLIIGIFNKTQEIAFLDSVDVSIQLIDVLILSFLFQMSFRGIYMLLDRTR